MIKKGFRLFLFIFICIVAIIYLRFGCEELGAIDVMPKVVGSASTDSIRINFGIMDTTYYPAVLDADSLIILIYPPDNAAPESTADGGAGVFNLTTGYYQYHRRGSNATPDVGIYTVCVKAWRGSAVRGIGVCSYLVTGAGTYHYGVQDSTRDLVKDSLANAIHADNKPNFMADVDSILQAIADANKANFMADVDSILQAIADANKPNFYNWMDAQRDSILNTVKDANKANYKATDFATAADGDSVIQAIADANKANFKYSGGADSVRAYLATHDSTLLETAAAGGASNWSNDQRDSVLKVLEDANKANFKATGFAVAGDAMALTTAERQSVTDTISGRVYDTLYIHKSDFYTWSAAERDDVYDSVLVIYDSLLALLDTIQAGFGSRTPIRATFVDSVDTVIKTVSSTPTGWGAHTLTLYLLNDSDSTAASGVIINVHDSASGEFQGGHITPANGIKQFSLGDGTFAIHLQDPPNAITSPEYMKISADTTDTFWVETFDPGTPPSGDQCRTWCIVPDLEGGWLEDCELTVSIPLKYHPVTLNGRIISPYSVSATSNDTGYVYLDPYESGELTAGDGVSMVKMIITLTAPNGREIGSTLAEIPDASDWEIEW